VKSNNKQPRTAAHRADEDSPAKRLCVTIDQGTAEILKHIQRTTGTDPSGTIRSILSSVSSGEIRQQDLVAFYRDVWKRLLDRPERNIVARYSLSLNLQNALYLLATEVLDERNASEMLRVLATFVAVKSGFVQVSWTKAAKLNFTALK
jgi:hypothetical protein